MAKLTTLNIPHEVAEQRFLIAPVIVNSTLPNHVTVFASGMNRLADLNAGLAGRVRLGVDVSRIFKAVIEKIHNRASGIARSPCAV